MEPQNPVLAEWVLTPAEASMAALLGGADDNSMAVLHAGDGIGIGNSTASHDINFAEYLNMDDNADSTNPAYNADDSNMGVLHAGDGIGIGNSTASHDIDLEKFLNVEVCSTPDYPNPSHLTWRQKIDQMLCAGDGIGNSNSTAAADSNSECLQGDNSAGRTPPVPFSVRVKNARTRQQLILDKLREHRDSERSNPGSGCFPTPHGFEEPPAPLPADQVPRDWSLAYVTRPPQKEAPAAAAPSWKEKPNTFTAIPGGPGDSQRYVGACRTFEYHLHGGAKTVWRMHEYYLFDPHPKGGPDLVIDNDMVLRVVFRSDNDTGSSTTRVPNTAVGGAAQSDQARSGDRRKARCWDNVTQIYDKHNKVVYAACNSCHRMFCASTGNGTTSLNRHVSACSARASASIQPQARQLSATA